MIKNISREINIINNMFHVKQKRKTKCEKNISREINIINNMFHVKQNRKAKCEKIFPGK